MALGLFNIVFEKTKVLNKACRIKYSEWDLSFRNGMEKCGTDRI